MAWTSWRDGNPEVYSAEVDGSTAARLTYWGDPQTRVTGWTAAGEVLAVTAANQPAAKYRRAYAVPGDGTPPRLLPFGAVTDVAIEDAGTALLTGSVVGEPAFWKRYRGGRTGKLWTARPRTPCSPGCSPTSTASWPARCSSPGGCSSCPITRAPATSIPARWTAAASPGIPIMTACTPGTRRPTGSGSCTTWPAISGSWTARTRRSRGGSRSPWVPRPRRRAPRLISAKDHLGALDCDQTGQASVVEVRGTVHWLTHKDGPARALHVDPGARARLPRVLGDTGQVVWVTDAAGDDALEIAPWTAPAWGCSRGRSR